MIRLRHNVCPAIIDLEVPRMVSHPAGILSSIADNGLCAFNCACVASKMDVASVIIGFWVVTKLVKLITLEFHEVLLVPSHCLVSSQILLFGFDVLIITPIFRIVNPF